MDDQIDWEQFAEQPNGDMQWDQFQEQQPQDVSNATIFGNPQNFAQKMEEFYRSSGIHGANRGFAKIFGFGKHRENAENNYQQALRTNPKATATGNALAQLYSSIPFLMAGGQAAQAIPGVGAGIGNYLGGAAGAGAMGAIATPEEGETRGGNALKDAGMALAIPAAGKIIGAGAKAVGKTVGKVAPNIGKSLTKNRVAESINKSFSGAKDKYSTLYEGLFKDARKAGVKTNLPSLAGLPKTAQNKIIKKATDGIDADTVKVVKQAFKTNSPKSVNKAQSKLGEYIRAEQKIKRSGGRIDPIALNKAKKLQKALNKELDTAFAKSNPDLAKRYTTIKSGYKKDVVPYSRNQAIQEFNAGEMVGEDLVAALRSRSNSGKAFRKHLADQHPELKINQILEKGVKLGAAGTTLGYGYNKLFGGK